jgi:hypothetical protein
VEITHLKGFRGAKGCLHCLFRRDAPPKPLSVRGVQFPLVYSLRIGPGSIQQGSSPSLSNPAALLEPEEQTLSILKYRLQNWSPANRWYPVLLRYISYIAGRVDAFGGNSALIPASPPGTFPVPPPIPPPGVKEYTGKVIGITYDRFGEFVGFELRTETGTEVKFRGREEKVEVLIRFAWEKRALITILEEGSSKWPASVVLRRL